MLVVLPPSDFMAQSGLCSWGFLDGRGSQSKWNAVMCCMREGAPVFSLQRFFVGETLIAVELMVKQRLTSCDFKNTWVKYEDKSKGRFKLLAKATM